MATERKAMFVVFKMQEKRATSELRDMFNQGYQTMFNLPGLFFKTWWVNQDRGEWGALYIFDSEKDLQSYVTSDLWVNKIPARWEVKPEVIFLEPGPIIAKKTVTQSGPSWLSE